MIVQFVSAEIILLVTSLLLLFADLFLKNEHKSLLSKIAILGFLATAYSLIMYWPAESLTLWGQYSLNFLSQVFKMIFVAAGLLTVLLAQSYLGEDRSDRDKISHPGEFYLILYFCVLGSFIVVSSRDLVTLFVGIELATIPLYVLSSLLKKDKGSNEAGVKFIVSGSLATALMVFGFSFLFGATGSLQFKDIAYFTFQQPTDPVLLFGAILVLLAISFKLAMVPFHMWAPDVYEGAPSPVTAFLSVGSKATALAFVVVLFLGPLYGTFDRLIPFFLVGSALSMTLGNLGALKQKNLRRFMAYSSVAQVGYILLAFLGPKADLVPALLFYLIAYLVSNFAAFFIFSIVGQKRAEDFKSLRGLGKQSPTLAACLMLTMFSLAGIPPVAGFIGKFFLFSSAAHNGHYGMVLFATLNSTLSLYYYLLIIKAAYISKAEEGSLPSLEVSFGQRISLLVLMIGILGLGLYPKLIEQIWSHF